MNRNTLIALGAGAMVAVAALVGGQFLSGPNAEAAGKSDLPREEIEAIVKEYILDNPEIILESVRRMQARDEAEEKARIAAAVAEHRDFLENGPGGFIAGNPQGDVTVVEFFDYHCTYCKQNVDSLMNVIKEDGNVRLVLREFPALRDRAPSMEAAVAAVAVMEQKDKYMPFHMALMHAKGLLTPERIDQIAQSVGVDLVAMNSLIKDGKIEDVVEHNVDIAHEIGIDGTPTFVIDGQVIVGLRSADDLRTLIKMARDQKKS